MSFDATRTGSGTKEWAEKTVNICQGCRNNCRYCYAAAMASRFKQRERGEWEREELTARANMASYPVCDGVVMFPSSHDVTPGNVEAYVRVAKLILAKGTRLLIVSKPRIVCIDELISELRPWKEQIQFRFTIGSCDEATCKFWEPGAPSPDERLVCLKTAHTAGFSTSVSIEPMLNGVEDARSVVEAVRSFVTETVWIGKMNQARSRVALTDGGGAAIDDIVRLQSDNEILRLVHWYRDDPMIRWKDSIKSIIEKG